MSNTLYHEPGHNGTVEVTKDPDYHNQIWIQTLGTGRAQGPIVNLDIQQATKLRDAVDAWLRGK